jgi:S1-C subfamily serine protease
VAGPGPGFWAVPLSADQKRAAGIPVDHLALQVTYLFSRHPTVKQSGLQLDDVVLAVDGQRRDRSIRQLHAHIQMNRNFGDRVALVVRRGSKELELTLPLPAELPGPE